jgi:putative restriction endonuclease
MAKFFGTPNGVKVGDLFVDRKHVRDAQVHLPIQSGISGNRAEGADSICMSGGYADDSDHGEYVLYTGHGGRDQTSGKQIADQEATAPGNAGMLTSWVSGLPLRVVRGANHKSPFSPPVGYQYAGLFLVTEFWTQTGADGFRVLRFRLDRLPEQKNIWANSNPDFDPSFRTAPVSRRIRDSKLSRHVKAIYEDRCQICQTRIPGLGGRRYSEGAHVKPLGNPHLGPDTLDNILCLCPNHHVQLDIGGMVILENFDVSAAADEPPFGNLAFAKNHTLNPAFADFHRNLWS